MTGDGFPGGPFTGDVFTGDDATLVAPTPDPERGVEPAVGVPAAEARARARARRHHPSARRARWEGPTRIAVATLGLIAIMFLFVFPTRSYLAQRRQVSSARRAVSVLHAQNERLAQEAKRLRTPGEIQRLARVQFNMVYPGEQAYSVIPAPPTSSTTIP